MKTIEHQISELGLDSTYRVKRIYLDGVVKVEYVETPIALTEQEAHEIALKTSQQPDCLVSSVWLHFKSGDSKPEGTYRKGVNISRKDRRLSKDDGAAPITAIVPVGERRHHDVVWTAPNPTFAPAAPSDAITGDCIRLLGFCPVMNDDPCMYGKCGNMDLKVPVPVEKPLQKDDRVRVTYGAYTGNTGTITAITRFKKRPELSFCVISWDDKRPASSYKLWMVERVADEPQPEEALVTVSCQMCKWTHAAPKDEALEALKHHLGTHGAPKCAKCGQPTGREAVGADDKIFCMKCGAVKLHEKPQSPAVEESEAAVEEAPAPRKIEQPKQEQIPMTQLRLF